MEKRICRKWRTESEQASELSFSPRGEIRPVSVFTICIAHALDGDSCVGSIKSSSAGWLDFSPHHVRSGYAQGELRAKNH